MDQYRRRWHARPLPLLPCLKRLEPLELLVENNDHYRSYRVDYHGGERYPHLEREASKPDMLEQILAPMVAQPTAPK